MGLFCFVTNILFQIMEEALALHKNLSSRYFIINILLAIYYILNLILYILFLWFTIGLAFKKYSKSPIVNHEKLTNARFLGSEIGTNRKIECHYSPVTRTAVLNTQTMAAVLNLRLHEKKKKKKKKNLKLRL
jgi:hypothetical protein